MKIDRPQSVVLDPVIALVLLTRLPMPRLPAAAFDHGARAVWAYPLVGIVVGGIGCLGGLAAMAAGLPAAMAAAIGLAVMMLATGAMHEDGLADVADGFWGGQDRERRLEIMKDSQIGTYGTLALIVTTGARWSALVTLLPVIPAAVIASAILSRAAMPLLMAKLPHARSNGLSHSVGRPAPTPVFIGIILSGATAFLLIGTAALPALALVLLTTLGMGMVALRKIAGQTGDVLGATQQLADLSVLALCISVLT